MTNFEKEKRNKDIIKLSEKLSQKEIGKIFNLSQSCIGLILKKNNIKRKKSRLNMSKLSINIDYFKIINTPKKAYWLGYITADGSINKTNNKLTINCKDLEILKKFKEDIQSEHKISEINVLDKRTNKIYHEYSLQIGNELFVKNIIDKGITNNKTDICFFPKINENLYSYFIAGLFDGDGCVCPITNNKTKIKCSLISTKEILEFINGYLENKFNVKPCKIQKITKNKNNVYKQNWYKFSLTFLNYIYQGEKEIYLNRKYSIYENFKQ